MAKPIVAGIPATNKDDRARAIYKVVGDSIQDGQETDGRRALSLRT
jgi:hypothetical protein